jgi:DNA (cytosine-5)-methyltransferase 1
MMGSQLGFQDEDRGQMFFRILDILKVKKPKYILLENVKNLFNHDKGNTFKVIKSCLENLGYTIYFDIFNSCDFHLAQTRNRVYILGIKGNQKKPVNFSAKAIKVHFDQVYQQTSVEKQESVLDVLEQSVPAKYNLSERIKPTILSDGSGSFKSNSEINQDPARPLTATMHKMHRACQDNYYSLGFIQSRGNDNPVVNLSKEELCRLDIRKLTPKEAMMLQGFPASWSLNAQNVNVSEGALYKQAGNAVSVNVVYAIMHYCITEKIIKL